MVKFVSKSSNRLFKRLRKTLKSYIYPFKIELLAKIVAAGSEFVDWRLWLLAASLPWPFPTQSQLLEQLHKYKLVDKNNTGFISRDTFCDVKSIV